MGRRYIIDHVISALNIAAKKESYDIYVAECLRVIAYNTADQEKRMTMRPYKEVVAPQAPKEDEQKADKIINRIKNKLKGG